MDISINITINGQIVQHTNERNVILLIFTGETGEVWQAAEGRDTGEDRVGLYIIKHGQ